MSEATSTDPRFADAPRSAEPAPEVATTLRGALGEGMSVTLAALHDEGLHRARLGLFGDAEARLRTLLMLDPEDTDAQVLLARVQDAAGRPADALATLDAALKAGGSAPEGLRERLEEAVRAPKKDDDATRARVAAREQSELRTLRGEARTLRSEAVQLQGEVDGLRRTNTHWKIATILGSVFGIGMLALFLTQPDTPAVITAPATAEEARLDLSLEPGSGDRTNEILAGTQPATTTAPTDAAATTPPAQATTTPPANPAPTNDAAATEPPAEAPATPAPTKKGKQACTAEKTLDSGACLHTVERGDTLGKIALRYYGKSSLSSRIEKANRKKLKRKGGLAVGSVLVIP